MYQQTTRSRLHPPKHHPNSHTGVRKKATSAQYNQPVQGMFSSLSSSIFGNKVPDGVQELKKLGGGYGVGYNAKGRKVVLYNRNGILAHVEIMTHGEDENISLHTGTDSGEVGGQGHMAAMFPVALQVVSEKFGDYPGIDMAPALGAATKGLISQLSRFRMKVKPEDRATRFSGVREQMAAKFLEFSDRARDRRKQEETRGTRKRPEAQSWDSRSMVETAHELNALAEMERAYPIGMKIDGLGPKFYEQLVGKNSPLLDGGAFAWHKAGDEAKQGMLQLSIPMEAVRMFVAQM